MVSVVVDIYPPYDCVQDSSSIALYHLVQELWNSSEETGSIRLERSADGLIDIHVELGEG